MNAPQGTQVLQTQHTEEIASWVTARAIPLQPAKTIPLHDGGLAPVAELARDALVTGIGGSTYGAHEQFTLTARIIELLVSELGYRTVATEDDWDVALPIDAYLRTGDGDLGALVASSGVPWQVAEIRATLDWLRQWNVSHASPEDQVRYVGVGVIDTRPEVYHAITGYLEGVAPDAAGELERHFAVLRPTRPDHVRWFIMEVSDKERYCEHARDVVALLAGLPAADAHEHELMLQHARQIQAFYEHYTFHLVDDGYRDEQMAVNLCWWQRYTGHRIAYWSTIAHSARAPDLAIAVPPRGELRFAATGSHLHRAYGPGYVSVGLTYNSGTVNTGWAFPPFTRQPVPTPAQPHPFAEYPLARVSVPEFAIDLRNAGEPGGLPAGVREWLHGPARTRIIGSIYDQQLPADEFCMAGGTLAEWFDVLIHQDKVTPTRDLEPG